jgi:hypothetical protein
LKINLTIHATYHKIREIMREWNLKLGEPLALTLAADARLGPTDYCDDQIWELVIGDGEPTALALQTTYGLRARSMRMFPRFTEGDLTQTDPAEFPRAPTIHKFYPNYLQISFSPLPDIDVEAEYWVPESKGVAGRLQITNKGDRARQIRLDWVAQLISTSGQRMATEEVQAAPVLAGVTEGLSPLVFLTGSHQAGRGAYPALSVDLNLSPGEAHQVTWSHAALGSIEESFALARNITARSWEAEITRLELMNAGQIEIHTGNPDWDTAFALSQKLAYESLMGPTPHLPSPSFVLTRLPDQGFSLRGDGSDYNHLWNGQTALDAYYLAGMILPSAPEIAKGLLRNFLAAQNEDGSVDWKPGLAGQRSRLLATPLLASLAWRIYQFTEDRSFLEESFSGLLQSMQAWFNPLQDRDEDGIPEWSHPMQAGLEDHPVFSRWQPGSLSVDISAAESPALCALLYHECQSLIQIAAVLERDEPVAGLQQIAGRLRGAMQAAWSEEQAGYLYWDRDTHYSTRGEKLGERLGDGAVPIQRSFEHPVRLLIRIETNGEITRHPEIFIKGEGASGQPRVERIPKEQFRWYMGHGSLTGDRVYSYLEQIDVQGLEDVDQVTVYSVDYRAQSLTLLLPFWAGIPDAEQADLLVRQSITSEQAYWQPFGLPACPYSMPDPSQSSPACESAQLPWCSLIGEGLLIYGYQAEAAELTSRLMAAVIQSLKQDHAFRRYYHTQTGCGSGEWNALSGLAPLGLFMETLGVRLISHQKVALKGFNPFPWPVTVKFRGITILCRKENSMVIFPDGQTVSIDDPAPCIISLEKVKE